jgi:hypothetical protein
LEAVGIQLEIATKLWFLSRILVGDFPERRIRKLLKIRFPVGFVCFPFRNRLSNARFMTGGDLYAFPWETDSRMPDFWMALSEYRADDESCHILIIWESSKAESLFVWLNRWLATSFHYDLFGCDWIGDSLRPLWLLRSLCWWEARLSSSHTHQSNFRGIIWLHKLGIVLAIWHKLHLGFAFSSFALGVMLVG